MQAHSRILPGLVAHADWGSVPNKRWMTVACLEGLEYVVGVPQPVGDLRSLIRRTLTRANGSRVILGFDFPIGVPAAYAQRAGIQNFLTTLPELGKGVWANFYNLAQLDSEINLYRPFYPFRPGGKRQIHLIQGLGVDNIDQLLRRCEQRQPERNAASPLFWTLGSKQVGRAAIIGWRDVIVPAMADTDLDVALWPFQGDLQQIINGHACVVVETYPAEACLHLGLIPPGRGWKKGSQNDRKAQVPSLLKWVTKRPAKLMNEAEALLRDGFGPLGDGEDRFDSMIGLLSMIEVLVGGRAEGAPQDKEVRKVEGWIFGQEDHRL